MAFCGPAAAMAFAESFGRNPTVEEAKQLASQVGWNAGQGMAGPSSEVALLNKLGIDTHMTQGVNWDQVSKDASSGNPVILDTAGHYFYVDGFNADTGQFHLGSSATDLKAAKGKEWFTPDQIPGLGMGDVRAAIFADHPLTGPGVAKGSPQAQSVGDWLGSNANQATSAVTQKAQDTMSAVLSTGQDTTSAAASWLDAQRSKLGDKFQSADAGVQDLLNQAGSTASSAGTTVQDLLNQATAPVQLAPGQTPARDQLGAGLSAAANTIDQQQQQSVTDQAGLGNQLLALGQNPLNGNIGDTVQNLLQQISTSGPIADKSADLSPSVSAGLTAAGVDPTTAQVLGQVANLIAMPAVEKAAPGIVDAATRAPGAALSGGLSLMDLLSAPELAYAKTQPAPSRGRSSGGLRHRRSTSHHGRLGVAECAGSAGPVPRRGGRASAQCHHRDRGTCLRRGRPAAPVDEPEPGV